MSIISGVGASPSVGPTSGGKVYAYNNLSTTPETVAAANPARVSITFHNPGTVDAFIAPQYVQTSGSNVALSPTTAALGGCLRVYANGGQITITGECQGQWQAFSASATSNALTVIDNNV
jgi:hypothetical protein